MVAKVMLLSAWLFTLVNNLSGMDLCVTICGLICGFCGKNADICPPVVNIDCKCNYAKERYYDRFTRVVVALGQQLGPFPPPQRYPSETKLLNDIEVIDIFSSYTVCENLPNFPYNNTSSVGGLNYEEIPIICGGVKNSSFCHSLQNGTWTPDANLTRERTNAAITSSPFDFDGTSLFITGGSKYSEILTEKGWRPSTPLPVGIRNHCMIKDWNRGRKGIMVIGGYQIDPNQPPDHSQEGVISHRTFYLNRETKLWSEGPSLIHRRASHACSYVERDKKESFGDGIIVVGGYDGRKPLTSTEVLVDGTWRSGPELPFGIEGAGLVNDYESGVILIGGFTGNAFEGTYKTIGTLFKLSDAGPNGKWVEMGQSLKTGRGGHATFMIRDDRTKCFNFRENKETTDENENLF